MDNTGRTSCRRLRSEGHDWRAHPAGARVSCSRQLACSRGTASREAPCLGKAGPCSRRVGSVELACMPRLALRATQHAWRELRFRNTI
eukprot:2356529-Prymnesium_polylepis.1